MKGFVENSDYLKAVAKEVKKKKVYDLEPNLLYEVAYASRYISSLDKEVFDKLDLQDVNSITRGI